MSITYIGSDQTVAHTAKLSDGNPVILYQTFTATAGTIDHLNIDIPSGLISENVALALYNSAGTSLLAYTNSFAVTGGVYSEPLVSNYSLSAGTYILAAFFNGYAAINTDGTTATLSLYKDLSGFPTFPASLSATTTLSDGVVALWGTAASSPAPTITSVNGELLPPTPGTITTSTTGGTIADSTTLYYVLTGRNANGETTASAEVTITTGSGTPPNSNSNSIPFTFPSGTTDIRVYQGIVSGQENIYFDAGTTSPFVDTGASGTVGSPPTTNTTGLAIAEGSTAVPVTGTNFASGMTANIVQGSNTIAQANVVYTNSTTGAFDLVMEPTSGPQLAATDSVYSAGLEITVAGLTSASFPVQLSPPAGVLFKTLASINPNAPLRFQTLPDLAVNDQVWAAGNSAGTVAAPAGLVLNSDGSFEFAAGYVWQNFWARVYKAADSAYTPYALITATGLQPGQGFFGGGGI